jgi:hypothetical protein
MTVKPDRAAILDQARAGVITGYRAAQILGISRQAVSAALRRTRSGQPSGPPPSRACPRCGAVLGARKLRRHTCEAKP